MSDFRAMRRHRQQLTREQSITILERATSGTLALLGDDDYPYAAARLLGNRYYPNHDEALQKEMEKGLHRMLMFRMRIEHLTGKEFIELTKRNG